MFDAIRNWFEVRAAMKDERRLRAGQALLNTIVVQDRLKHVAEMLQAGQVAYATATMDEVLARYPDEAAELPLTITILINLKRLDDAEAVALRGMQRNPDSRDFVRLYGDVADQRGDIPERLRRWRSFRRRYPAFGLSFRMEAYALLAAGEDAAAERLLAEGVRIVTDDVSLAIDYARRAEARRDWPEAQRRWTVVRDAFEDPIGPCGLAQTLVEQGMHDQAEAELMAARSRFPLEPKIVEDLAALAERRGNLDGALAYCAELRRDLPHVTRGYTEAARLLRERGDQRAADAMIGEGAARAPDDRALQFDHAALAERDGDWVEAARRWEHARKRFESDPVPYGREAAALRAQGQLDQAEALLLDACQRFPDAVNIQQASAELAETRGDLTLAVRHWRAVVATEPDVWWNRTSLARALARGGDRAGADDALAAAIARLPDEPMLYAEYAVMAAQDGRADAAAARWAAARQRFGLHPTLAGGEANWLRGQGRLAEAKAILGAASQQAPNDAGLLHDLGHLAAQDRDWPEAERCWRAILALQPQAGWAYGELARALREQGRVAEAEGVLADAWAQHPQDFGIGTAWARETSEAKDWPEARRRWALLRERFPAESLPVWQEGIALREAGETEQAGALFAAGAERFPADASFPHDLARLAEARQNHAQAEHWWRRYQTLQPGAWWGWVGRATAVHAQGRLDEAEELLLRGDDACPTVHAFLHLRAEWARHRRDWPEAERRAAALAARFPDAWEGLWGQAVAAGEQGRLDDARGLLQRGATRYPDVTMFAHDLARLAEARQDWQEAEHWWRGYLALDDDAAWAHSALAAALKRQDRLADANAVLREANHRFSADPHFADELAAAASRRGDHHEAERIWRAVLAQPGAHDWAVLKLVGVLHDMARWDDAEDALQDGQSRLPQSPQLAIDFARAADRRGDREASTARWTAVLARFPDLPVGYAGAIAALRKAGHIAAAYERLRDALHRFPQDPHINAEAASVALQRGSWDESAELWTKMEQVAPGASYVAHRIFEARSFAVEAAAAAGSDGAPHRLEGLRALASRPLGQRVVAGSVPADSIVAPGWRSDQTERMRALREHNRPLSYLHTLGAGLLDCMDGRHDVARARIGNTIDASEERYPNDTEMFRNLLRMAIFACQWDVAIRLLRDRFCADWCAELSVADESLPQYCVLWEIGPDGRSSFRFNRTLYTDITFLERWTDTVDLFFDYTMQPDKEQGRVTFSTHDHGMLSGLAPSDHRPDCFLIPDMQFVGSEGYRQMRVDIASATIPWDERTPRAVWRGSAMRPTNRDMMPDGSPTYDVQRIKLCVIARDPGSDGLIDAAVTGNYSFPHNEYQEFKRLGLVGDFVPQREFCRFKYQVDVDGIANAWSALFAKLLTGSPVLKVESAFGFRQWFYDDLIPWENFVPVEPDLSDLVEKVRWLRDHDNDARRIGENGRALADRLTVNSEFRRARATISAAIRHCREAGPSDAAMAPQEHGGVEAAATGQLAMDLRDFAAACAWARQAVEAKDWSEAQRRWAHLRDRFPAEGHPWWQEAIALREAGQVSEAQALLLAGASRFPHDSSFPHDLARLAEGRGDWPEAERWWHVFLGLHPNLWWAHTGLAQALTRQERLDDAEAALWAAHEALPNDHPILLEYARLAEQRRDWAETERRFRHLADRFPDVSDGPWRLAAAVREQGRIDEAEHMLREGFARHPNSIHFPNDLAHLAQARGDWAAAEQWWRALLAIDPNIWWAHTALANALHQQGRRSDAEAVLHAAHAALPGEPNILIDHARLAEHAGDWPAALERWTLMVDRLPADPRGHIERATALRQLGRHEEAEATLIVTAERFPHERRPLHDLARAAEMRADWAAAERWWRAHGAIDPNAWEAQVGLAAALCQQGDVAPAMAILQALGARPDRDPFRVAMMAAVAFDHAPDVTVPWLEQLAEELAGVISAGQAPPLAWLAHANLAKRREQFEECRARLEDAAARFPDDRGIWLALADARELAPRDSEAGAAPPVIGAAAVEQDADRRLLESFESLGGTPGGCEFGLHQRDHGFEPLSLLRWASIAPDQLCRLLEQHCEGLGAPQTVSLRTQGHPDWQAVELTYGIQMDHTHLDRKTVPIETATRLVCTRLKFLARKLIDDLRTGEKVFVYRLSDAIVPPDLAARLQQAMAAYGDGRLLLVGEGTPATPPIELQRLSPRCVQIIRAPIGQTATHAARLASWQAICRAAADAFGLAALAEAGTP